MEKVVNVDGKDVKFRVSFPMFYIYKNTFGKDLLQTLIPALMSLTPSFENLKNGEMEENVMVDILNAINHFEITDITNILWAAAKNANNEIPDVVEWLSGFNSFPIFDIAQELLPILVTSLFTTKNLQAALRPAATK